MKKAGIGILIGLILGMALAGSAQLDFFTKLLEKVNKTLDTEKLQLTEQKEATANLVKMTHDTYKSYEQLAESAANMRRIYEQVRNISDIDFKNVNEVTDLILNFDRPGYWMTGLSSYTKENLRNLENTKESMKKWNQSKKDFYQVIDEDLKKEVTLNNYKNLKLISTIQLMSDNLVQQDMAYGEQLKRRSMVIEEMIKSMKSMRITQYEQIQLRKELEKEQSEILKEMLKNEENKISHLTLANDSFKKYESKKFAVETYKELTKFAFRNKDIRN